MPAPRTMRGSKPAIRPSEAYTTQPMSCLGPKGGLALRAAKTASWDGGCGVRALDVVVVELPGPVELSEAIGVDRMGRRAPGARVREGWAEVKEEACTVDASGHKRQSRRQLQQPQSYGLPLRPTLTRHTMSPVRTYLDSGSSLFLLLGDREVERQRL